jgi:hypothetical protein
VADIFEQNRNQAIRGACQIYDAEHLGIAACGLGPGIAFVFSDFCHLNGHDSKRVEDLVLAQVDPIKFFTDHQASIKKLYGVELKPDCQRAQGDQLLHRQLQEERRLPTGRCDSVAGEARESVTLPTHDDSSDLRWETKMFDPVP